MAKKLKTHPLIQQLSEDAKNFPEGVVELIGFLGPANEAGYYRVYASLDLHSWTEISEEAIVLTEPVNSSDENSPTRVLVKNGTRVRSVQSTTHDVADYLGGGIAESYLAESAAPHTASPCVAKTAFLVRTFDRSTFVCCVLTTQKFKKKS